MNLFDLRLNETSISFCQRYIHTLFQHTSVHTSNRNTTGIRRVIQRSNKHLRSSLQLNRSRYVFNNTIKKRNNCFCRLFPVSAHPAILSRTVYSRKIKLFFSSVKAKHEVKHHFMYFVGTTIGFVYLINNNNWFQPYLQSFLEYETRLRHRTFKSVNQ